MEGKALFLRYEGLLSMLQVTAACQNCTLLGDAFNTTCQSFLPHQLLPTDMARHACTWQGAD